MKEKLNFPKKCLYVKIDERGHVSVSKAVMSEPHDETMHGVIPCESEKDVFICRIGDYVKNVIRYVVEGNRTEMLGANFIPTENLDHLIGRSDGSAHGLFSDVENAEKECLGYVSSEISRKYRELVQFSKMADGEIEKIRMIGECSEP